MPDWLFFVLGGRFGGGGVKGPSKNMQIVLHALDLHTTYISYSSAKVHTFFSHLAPSTNHR